MALQAPTHDSSDNQPLSYGRLCYALVDVGCLALRTTFDKIYPPEKLYPVLKSRAVYSALELLKKEKILSATHWCKLYPAIPSSVTSASFDLVLLGILLREVCCLDPPATGWNNLPPATDTTRQADIARVNYYRNAVYHYNYSNQTSLSEDGSHAFMNCWQDIRDMLVRLVGVRYAAADIDWLKHGTVDKETEVHHHKLLWQWKNEEDSIHGKLATLEGNEEICKRLHDLRSAIAVEGQGPPTQGVEFIDETEDQTPTNQITTVSMKTETDVGEPRTCSPEIREECSPSLPYAQRRPCNPWKDMKVTIENLNDTLQSGLSLTLEGVKVEGRPPRHSTRLPEQTRRVHSEDASRAAQAGESSSRTSPQHPNAYISTVALQTRTRSLPGTPHRHPSYEDYESKMLVESEMVSTQSSVMAPGGLSSRCVKSDGRKASQDFTIAEPLESAMTYSGTHSTICDFCQKQGFYICRNCFLVLCGKCKRYYTADICAVTKGSHSLAQLKAVELSSRRSVTTSSYPEHLHTSDRQDMWTNNQFVVPEVRDGKSVYAAVLRHTSSHEDSPRLMQTDKKNGLQNTPSNVRRTEPGFEVRNKITAGEQNISQYCGSRGVMDLEPRSNSDTGLYSSTCHNDLTRASITDTSTTNQSLQLSTYPTDALSEEALYGSTGSIQTPLKSERTHATEEPIVSCGETQAECSPSMSSTYERHSERNGKTDQQSRIRSSPSTKAIFTGSRREDKDTAALQTVHSQYANDLIIQKRPGKPEEDTQLRFKYLNGNLQSRLALESDKVEGSLPQDSTKLLDQKRGVHSEDATRAVQSGERSSCTSPQSTSASISTGDLQTRTSLLPGTPHMHPGYEDSESKILVQSKMVSTQSSVMASAGLSSRRCVKSDSRKASQDCGAPEPLESATRYPGTHSTICDFCQKQGSYICRNCFLVLCGKCKSYYTADICAVTKGSHSLAQLKAVELSSRRSVTTSSYPEHLHTSDRTVNDRAKSNTPKETREEWSCKRCTFLNFPDHNICSICACTRGVDGPGLPPPKCKVCKHCTFYNKEGSKVCEACHRPIDLTKAATCI